MKLKIQLSSNRAAAQRLVRWLRPVVSVSPVTPAEAFLDRDAAKRPASSTADAASSTAVSSPSSRPDSVDQTVSYSSPLAFPA